MMMRTIRFYRGFFLVAAGYDLFLGFVFFVFYNSVYSAFSIELPNNPAYIHLSAAFTIAQGFLYYFVYRNLQRNIDIVKVGVAYKIAYTGVAFYYWSIGMVPHPMFILFGFLDLIFIAFFLLYLRDYETVILENA